MALRVRGLTFVALAALALTLAACGSDKDAPDPRMPPKDSSQAFKDGFTNGCAAGVEDADDPGKRLAQPRTAAAKAAAERYGKDMEFKNGWDKGYFACYDDETS